MHERKATGVRAWIHAAKAAAESTAFALWRPIRGNQRLERPIFMIGCPRSGTSVAVQLMGRHPEVANFSEAGEVWDPQHYADPEADHYWTAADVTPREAARIHDRFEFARRLRGGGRLLNKHPRNSVRIEYLRTVFPDAVFIHVIRDGRAVAHSILDMIEREPERKTVPMGAFCKPPNWRDLLRDDPVEQAALQWREIVTYILGQREALDGTCHQFRYEDLCQDARGVMGRAFRFAGLRADEGVLSCLPEYLTVQNFKWRQAFSPAQIETLARVQGTLLRQLGYDV
jgi:hypothetical protein